MVFKKSMDYNRELTHILGQQIKRRFEQASSIGGIDIKLVERDDGVHWEYKGVECHVNFYENKKKPHVLYFNMSSRGIDSLADCLEKSLSGSEIEKSEFLRRPLRTFSENSYAVSSSIKKKITDKKKRDEMLGYVWGRVIAPMLGTAAGLLKN